MAENTAETTLSEQDIDDLAALGLDENGEPIGGGRSLLHLWREVLSHVEESMNEPVSMGVAGKIVAGWPQISYQETQRYHELYHEHLLDFRAILHAVLEDHPEAADVDGDHDLEENGELYKTLVVDWNLRLDELELAWRATDEDSHIAFAALVDARGFLFSRTGFAGHLEARGFTLDSQEIIDAITAMRGEQ